MVTEVGNGKICYLEIPALDIEVSSAFYRDAFDWTLRKHGDGTLAFDDGVGEVSGMWVLDRAPMSEPGIIISIMVDDAEANAARIVELGGTIVRPVDPSSSEKLAWFRDPAGNLMGTYQADNS
jgi:predicted enzyme related to lactoylglutathione lyase